MSTGACGYNRPCAHQYVGKSQSCMVISVRLIVHAPVPLDLLVNLLPSGTLHQCCREVYSLVHSVGCINVASVTALLVEKRRATFASLATVARPTSWSARKLCLNFINTCTYTPRVYNCLSCTLLGNSCIRTNTYQNRYDFQRVPPKKHILITTACETSLGTVE